MPLLPGVKSQFRQMLGLLVFLFKDPYVRETLLMLHLLDQSTRVTLDSEETVTTKTEVKKSSSTTASRQCTPWSGSEKEWAVIDKLDAGSLDSGDLCTDSLSTDDLRTRREVTLCGYFGGFTVLHWLDQDHSYYFVCGIIPKVRPSHQRISKCTMQSLLLAGVCLPPNIKVYYVKVQANPLPASERYPYLKSSRQQHGVTDCVKQYALDFITRSDAKFREQYCSFSSVSWTVTP